MAPHGSMRLRQAFGCPAPGWACGRRPPEGARDGGGTEAAGGDTGWRRWLGSNAERRCRAAAPEARPAGRRELAAPGEGARGTGGSSDGGGAEAAGGGTAGGGCWGAARDVEAAMQSGGAGGTARGEEGARGDEGCRRGGWSSRGGGRPAWEEERGQAEVDG